jgi:hypothetical protein
LADWIYNYDINFRKGILKMKKSIRLIALALVTVMACLALVSCGGPNSDPEKAKDALKDAGYTVVLNDGDGLIGGALLPDGVEAQLVAYKDGEYIAISYYDDTDALNDAWDEAQDEAKELEEEYEDLVCKKSGKMIYVGTKQAVKDAQ